MNGWRPLPVEVRLVLMLWLDRRAREFVIGDLEELWNERARTRGWLWRQAVALVWAHHRGPGSDSRAPSRVVSRSRDGHFTAVKPRLPSVSLVDVRQALRGIVSRPGLSMTLVGTLGGGIALATVMFSVLNAILLVPLPYGDADGLVAVWEHHVARSDPYEELSPANYLDLRDRTRALTGIAGISDGSVNLTGISDPERIDGQLVTWNYFQVLGVTPALGRGFAPADERVGAPPTAVLSARLWMRRFQSDPTIIGRSVRLDDRSTMVIGVMPLQFVPPGSQADLWLPMRFDEGMRNNRTGHFVSAVGRLRPGITVEGARADLDSVFIALEREARGSESNLRSTVVPLRDQLAGTYKSTLTLLFGAVCFVLLMACANAANLLLARAAVRRREMAIRLAIGADRSRLRGLVLTESLLVAGAAGSLGLVASLWGISLVNRVLPSSLTVFAGSGTGWALTGDAVAVALDWRVLAFATVATLTTGLLFGSIPAHQTSDVSAHDVLRQIRTVGGVRARTRKVLVISQLAIAVVLLVAAGLLLRSVLNLQRTDPGFDAQHVVTLRTVLSPLAYANTHDRRRFYDAVVERVKRLPGVEATGFTTFLPLTFEGLGGGVAIESRPVADTPFPVSARFRLVTHDYLQALRVPLVAGRLLADADAAESTKVAVVNEALARAVWKDDFTRALGQRVMMFGSPTGTPDRWLTVVGIVGSVRQSRLDAPAPLEVYALQAQGSPFVFAEPRDLAVRVSPSFDPVALAPTLRAIIHEIDSQQPVTDVRLLADIVRQGSAGRRAYLWIIGGFAMLTLALGAFGLASVMSYLISARRQELTVRLAVGALPRQIMALVMTECAVLVGTGLALGVGGALLAARAMRAWLYETAPTDPVTLVVVPVAFALVCFAGCFQPVWRATKLEPGAALRVE
jgi:putative ABC transport system permease protein